MSTLSVQAKSEGIGHQPHTGGHRLTKVLRKPGRPQPQPPCCFLHHSHSDPRPPQNCPSLRGVFCWVFHSPRPISLQVLTAEHEENVKAAKFRARPAQHTGPAMQVASLRPPTSHRHIREPLSLPGAPFLPLSFCFRFILPNYTPIRKSLQHCPVEL